MLSARKRGLLQELVPSFQREQEYNALNPKLMKLDDIVAQSSSSKEASTRSPPAGHQPTLGGSQYLSLGAERRSPQNRNNKGPDQAREKGNKSQT